jgi:hypothetical protein
MKYTSKKLALFLTYLLSLGGFTAFTITPASAVPLTPYTTCYSGACSFGIYDETAPYTWTVPTGVTSINFTIAGGQGGGQLNRGGGGGKFDGSIVVDAGQSFIFYTGAAGTDSSISPSLSGGRSSGGPGGNDATGTKIGSAGGAHSEIVRDGVSLAIAAGGGGRGGSGGRGGDGGIGLFAIADAGFAAEGDGGGLGISSGGGGGGGNGSVGGSGGPASSSGGNSGSSGNSKLGGSGGKSGISGASGGGGGGGYFGGGGGGGTTTGGGGGGGGGSNYYNSSEVTGIIDRSGAGDVQSGPGEILVSYQNPLLPLVTLQPVSDATTAGLTSTFTIASPPAPAGMTKAVQWQVATNTVSPNPFWANVNSGSGFTTETFTTGVLGTAMNQYRYRALLIYEETNLIAFDYSSAATSTVNPIISFTSETATVTNKYGASGTTTRAVTFTGGTDTKTVSANALSLADGMIRFDTSTAQFTIDTRTAVGTYNITVNITDAKGAVASYVQTIISTVADTLTVTSETLTVTYPGSDLNINPNISASGLVSGDVISGTVFTYSNLGGNSYGPTTTRPTNAGSYTITPSALTFSSGANSNYAAIIYSTSTLTINKAAQATLTVVTQYQPFNSNPTSTTLLTTGGSDTGTVTYAYVPEGSTAGGCQLSGVDSSTLTVTSDGTCRIVATKAATENYLVAVSEIGSITFNPYISYLPVARPQEFPSEIVLVGKTEVIIQIDAPAIITSGTPTSQSVGGTVTLTGSGFTGTTSVKIKGVLVSFVVVSDTTLTFTVPAELGGRSGRIVVENAAGISISDTLFAFTA